MRRLVNTLFQAGPDGILVTYTPTDGSRPRVMRAPLTPAGAFHHWIKRGGLR